MVKKGLALGITAFVISNLLVNTAYVLVVTESNERIKNDIIVDDQEIISDKFLYYHGIKISWLEEAGFRITSGDLVVYLDPYEVSSDAKKADIVICTHHHGEHFSLTDVIRVRDSNTSLYTPEPNLSVDGIGPTRSEILSYEFRNVTFVEPGMVVNHSGIILEFVPAYNVYKDNPQTGQPWHPRWANWVGVIVEIGGTRIYHAGDSEHIPEMEEINCDIFLAPIGGVAVMTPQEGAEAVESLKITSDLKYAIPMHYTYYPISTAFSPAVEFAAKANCTVVILKPEWAIETHTTDSSMVTATTEISQLTSNGQSSHSSTPITTSGLGLGIATLSIVFIIHSTRKKSLK
ncbi:MAG: MBL fold metallo-hydrolase [Candidatus Hermodarchaeota archaeon]